MDAKNEIIREHKRLIRVLSSKGTPEDRAKEFKIQRKELMEYMKKKIRK